VKLTLPGTTVRRLDIAEDGIIWYVNSGQGRLGRYDPKTGQSKEWMSPSGQKSHPYAIAVVNGNVHILPGVPRLFERLLLGLKPLLVPRLADPEGKGTFRFLFATPLPESAVAPFLTELAAKVEPKGIKVGSYPRWGKKWNTVTLVGADKAYLESLVAEVEAGVEGKLVVKEDELDPHSDTEHVYSQ